MPQRIEDYALVGDLETAALIGIDGSVDWLCLPRFDSDAVFTALLGDESHGRWLIAPAGEVTATRRHYRAGTLVLETHFETPEGHVRVIDCMPPRDKSVELIRVVEGMRGLVQMRMDLALRFNYGKSIPWVRRVDGALLAIAGPDAVWLTTSEPTHGRDLRTESEFAIADGDRVGFALTWQPSHLASKPDIDPAATVERTMRWWRRWSGQMKYDGPDRELVERSLITLKALTYAPTGGIVAAPTTSLPEAIGGVRNWDYRYCWVRDATLTLAALLDAGYVGEASAWRDWLLRAVAGRPADMQIMYGPAGERRLTEVTLDWLPGYEASKPVRVGNAASEQFQLDVYGELMDVLLQSRDAGLGADHDAWQMQVVLLDFLETAWREPDEGIWEVRGGRQHFTHSKVMAWVAFDRGVRMVEVHGMDGPVDRWRGIRDEIHREVCERAWDPERRTFTQYYGSRALDAATLLIPAFGFLPPDDERVIGTIEAVQRELMADGLVLRYRTEEPTDGLPPGEGAFLPCTFWLVDALSLIGRDDEARSLFDRLTGLCNDVGLLSEEYDAAGDRLVGNFPQAFSHVGLVASAFRLHRERGVPAVDRSRSRSMKGRT
jgi:GH15 family glucan-1,4-alpha-glucosidase